MDSSPTTSTILDTLRTVEFRLGLKGYNVDEVDEYLDRAAQEADALQENIRQLNERLRQAGDRIAQLEKEKRSAPAEEVAPAAAAVGGGVVELAPSDETLQRTLILAQKFVDQIKRESEAEAATTVAQAEERARATLTAAEEAASNLQTESQRQVREEVARLEATRTELASDVESMARHLESERNRLRDALTEILNWVDENVQPADSIMGTRPKAAPAAPPAPAAVSAPAPAAAPKAAAPAPGAAAESPAVAVAEDDDQPTLNLQAVADEAGSGATRPA